MDNVINQSTQANASWLDGISNTVEKFMSSASKIIDFIDNAIDSAKKILNVVKEKSAALWQSISQMATSVVNTINDGKEMISDIKEGNFSEIDDNVASLSKNINEFSKNCTDIIESGKEIIDESSKIIKEEFSSDQ